MAWRVPIICGAINRVLTPQSIIDAGCGTADLVQGFINMGIPAWGIEGLSYAEPYLVCARERVLFADLRKPLMLEKKYSVALCFEVAEHIEVPFADTFVRNLCSLADTIVMSAAGPGQGGINHFNCRDARYWMQMFAPLEYERLRFIEDAIKEHWKPYAHKKFMRSLYQNLYVFRRDGKV